jgi:hypothetical protein
MASPHVLSLFGRPDRKAALAAIGRVIHLIRRNHAFSFVEIAKVVECSPDTLERAYRHETQLQAETIASLLWAFPDCAGPWERLCRPEAVPEATIEERLERIEREASTIRRAIAEQAA